LSNDGYKYLIDYYKTIVFPSFCYIQKKYAPKTAHRSTSGRFAKNTFFLILCGMGLENRDVRRIMGINYEAIRSIRYRIMQNMKK
jgi:hypothetical protein